jgi:hypothetical protein
MGIVSSLCNYFRRPHSTFGNARFFGAALKKACAHIIPAKAIAMVFMAGVS